MDQLEHDDRQNLPLVELKMVRLPDDNQAVLEPPGKVQVKERLLDEVQQLLEGPLLLL